MIISIKANKASVKEGMMEYKEKRFTPNAYAPSRRIAMILEIMENPLSHLAHPFNWNKADKYQKTFQANGTRSVTVHRVGCGTDVQYELKLGFDTVKWFTGDRLNLESLYHNLSGQDAYFIEQKFDELVNRGWRNFGYDYGI